MRKNVLIISLIIFEVFSYSQQQPNLLQLVRNPFIFNPAYAGVDGYTAINTSSHSQWLGTKSSPKTNIFSAHGRLIKKKFSNKYSKIGLGAYFFDERSDLLSKTGLNLTYSYHFYIGSTQLSLGLALTGFQSKLNTKDAYTLVPNDPMFSEGRNQMFIPNTSVGFFLWSYIGYVGFSANQLMQNIKETGIVSSTNYNYKRHYNLNLGNKYNINKNYKIEPSVLFKYYENGILQSDIVVNFDSQRPCFLFGFGYRTNIINPYENSSFNYNNSGSNSGLLVLLGTSIIFNRNNDIIYFDYSIEYPLNVISQNKFGTHGIIITYKFRPVTKRKYKYITTY